MILKLFTAYALVGLFANQCLSQITYQYTHGINGERVFTETGPGDVYPQDGFRAYDNWRTPSQGGVSRLRGTFVAGTDEIADALELETSGPALLSDIGFSIFNKSVTSPLQDFRITIRFYDSDRRLLGLDTFHGSAISPNTGVAYYSGGGFYRGFEIMLPTHVFMSTQITEIVGVDVSDIAVVFSGPRTTGYSSQFAYDFTNGQIIDFDGTDQTNMKYFIDTVDVPSTSVGAVVFAALPLALRHRR